MIFFFKHYIINIDYIIFIQLLILILFFLIYISIFFVIYKIPNKFYNNIRLLPLQENNKNNNNIL